MMQFNSDAAETAIELLNEYGPLAITMARRLAEHATELGVDELSVQRLEVVTLLKREATAR